MPSKQQGPRPRNQADYKRNKQILLAENPFCHWCGMPASEADHLIEVDRGGDNSLGNMVSACRKCNATRGNQYRAARDAGKQNPANPMPVREIENNNRTNFLRKRKEAPVSTFSIYPKGLEELARTSHDQPRLETMPHDLQRSSASRILGFARDVLGVDLMPWQVRALHGQTAVSDDGTRPRVSLVSVARQNGKTVCIASLLGDWLLNEARERGTPQTVISVAHKLDLATSLFNYLAPILEVKCGAEVSWSYGRQKLTMPDGSVWHVRAATPGAGHGYSVDLLIIDEAWAVSTEAIDQGLLPTQRARKNPLCSMWSTAGDSSSTAMLRWREQGLRTIDEGKPGSLYFAEWSPDPAKIDLMTPEAWAYANPALGYTLDMEVIKAESEAPNRNAFLRSSVNTWVASSASWLEPGQFAACETDAIAPPGGVLAVEVGEDSANFYGVRAVITGTKTHVVTAFVADTMAEMWAKVEAEIQAAPNLKLALVPSLEVHCPPALLRRATIVGYRELNRWTAAVRSMIIEQRLLHNGEHLLTEHVEKAVLVKHNGNIVISSQRSSGPISMARALVFACALAGKPAAMGKPIIVSAAG
jgi:phage terminase large subunit-like protein